LNQFGLLEIYGDDIGRSMENNVLDKEQTSQFSKVLKKDKKLAKLWKKAELSAFSGLKLNTVFIALIIIMSILELQHHCALAVTARQPSNLIGPPIT